MCSTTQNGTRYPLLGHHVAPVVPTSDLECMSTVEALLARLHTRFQQQPRRDGGSSIIVLSVFTKFAHKQVSTLSMSHLFPLRV